MANHMMNKAALRKVKIIADYRRDAEAIKKRIRRTKSKEAIREYRKLMNLLLDSAEIVERSTVVHFKYAVAEYYRHKDSGKVRS